MGPCRLASLSALGKGALPWPPSEAEVPGHLPGHRLPPPFWSGLWGWLSGRRRLAGAQPGAAVREGMPPSAAVGLLPCSAGLCTLRLSSPQSCSPCAANWPWSLHLGVSGGPGVGHLRPSGDWPRGSTDTFPSSGLGVRPQPGVQGLLLSPVPGEPRAQCSGFTGFLPEPELVCFLFLTDLRR